MLSLANRGMLEWRCIATVAERWTVTHEQFQCPQATNIRPASTTHSFAVSCCDTLLISNTMHQSPMHRLSGSAVCSAQARMLRHTSLQTYACSRQSTSRATASKALGHVMWAGTDRMGGDSSAEDSDYDYDVFVIGGGSGGVRAARTAASQGAKVAIAELPLGFLAGPDKGGVGGTCVLRGCVPKKLMLYASEFATEAQASKGFGWKDVSAGRLDWDSFLEAKRQELKRLNKIYRDNLQTSGAELLEGRARVVGENEVQLDGSNDIIRAKNIVIATGGQASHIPIPGAEHAIISDEVLELKELPSVVTLIGGGYIGMEFAGMFARLGCEVHVVARQALPLAPRFDKEVCGFFMEQCKAASGIHMHMNTNPTEIIKESDGSLTVKLESANKDKQTTGSTDSSSSTEIRGNGTVVLAVGRAGKTKGLGLEEIGVEMGPKGNIKVDKYSRSNVHSIWAVGDVTSRIALTPVAIMEGQAVGNSIATGELEAPEYEAVPSACFSWPFVATVGLTEQQVVQRDLHAEVYTTTFTPLKARLAARAEGAVMQQGFVKMLVEVGSGKVLGLHMVGEDAPEIVQGFSLAVKLGLTKQQVDSLVGIHPTSAEEVLGLKGPDRVVGPSE